MRHLMPYASCMLLIWPHTEHELRTRTRVGRASASTTAALSLRSRLVVTPMSRAAVHKLNPGRS